MYILPALQSRSSLGVRCCGTQSSVTHRFWSVCSRWARQRTWATPMTGWKPSCSRHREIWDRSDRFCQLLSVLNFSQTWVWTVPQLSVMIIYNSTWSVLIQWIRVMIVRWQNDLVKEIVPPVCDKPYHINKSKVQKGEEIEVLQNCAL